ncbi:MAG: NADPH-dependent F420 reductase [Dehalococcoidia bacterium]|nr:NADPH-dependent F420 reductase [Dehalococcoidia bacterium]
MEPKLPRKLGMIGGTGPEGIGLAIRHGQAGREIVIGSRSQERAEEAASKVLAKVPGATVRGALNEEAAREADLVVNVLPFVAQSETLPKLKDGVGRKILISCVAPLKFEKSGVEAIPVAEGSAAEQAQELLPEARVVGAFQTLSAVNLRNVDHDIAADVLVTSDDAEAKEVVMELCRSIPGLRPIDAGSLANSRYVEQTVALLLGINRRYKGNSELRIVGLPEQAAP